MYYIHSLNEYDEMIKSIKDTCKYYNARAYISLNPRNTKTVALQALRIMADYIASGNYIATEHSNKIAEGFANYGRFEATVGSIVGTIVGSIGDCVRIMCNLFGLVE